jgi:hypothetical protein
MKLPTLYKKTSKGAIEQWTIWVEVDENHVQKGDPTPPYHIFTEYGHVGGKMQIAKETVWKGKNIGKKNETTAKEQAEAQARSEWETKKNPQRLRRGPRQSGG